MAKLAYSETESYTLTTFNSSRVYNFKVRVCYPCGCGPFSDHFAAGNGNSSFNSGGNLAPTGLSNDDRFKDAPPGESIGDENRLGLEN